MAIINKIKIVIFTPLVFVICGVVGLSKIYEEYWNNVPMKTKFILFLIAPYLFLLKGIFGVKFGYKNFW